MENIDFQVKIKPDTNDTMIYTDILFRYFFVI